MASSRDRHTANTAEPLPDISAPHEPRPVEALANLLHSRRQRERRLLQPVEERPAHRLRVAGPHAPSERVAANW